MENLIDSEPGRTCDEASREDHNTEDRQSFAMGSVDSTVGESSQKSESQSLTPTKEIRSRGFQLFDEQPIVRHP